MSNPRKLITKHIMIDLDLTIQHVLHVIYK